MTEEEKGAELKRLAYVLCKAAEGDADPEQLVYFGTPYTFECHAVGYPAHQQRPLWRAYIRQARAMFEELHGKKVA